MTGQDFNHTDANPSPPAEVAVENNSKLNRRDAAAIAGLVVIVVGLFWRVLFTSDMLYFRDIFNYSYPHAKFIHEICRTGHLPYWNPLLNWGQPLLSNPNTLFFYPYTLVMILLPVSLAYPLHYVVHFSIAAVGAYLLARRWGQSSLSAFFAAAFFAFSGPVLSLGNFYNMAACVAWLPWALYFTDVAMKGRSLRPWILLALVFTLQFLAGEPMTLMATFGLATLYALHLAGGMRRLLTLSSVRVLAAFFLIGLVMLALASVGFLPSLQLLSNSRRGTGLTFWQAGFWSFHPFLFIEFLAPDFYGSPLGNVNAWKMSLNSAAVPLLLSYFLGFIPIFLALAGWINGRDGRRRFAAAGIGVFMLLALGRFTPLYEILFSILPPLRLVRFPVKLLLPAVLLMALLAGFGFDDLRRAAIAGRPRRMLQIVMGAFLAVSTVIWILSFLRTEWISAPAQWILLNANRTFTVPPDKPLTLAEASGEVRYFITMVQVHFPGLIGYSLGALAWLAAFERGKDWSRKAAVWIGAAGVLTLVYVNYGVNPVAPKSFYDYRPPVLAHTQDSAQPYRFCDIYHDRKAVHRASELADFVNFDSIPETAEFSQSVLGTFREKIMLSAGTMLDGVESATSSDVDSSVSEPYYTFWGFERAQAGDKLQYDCLLGRANVKYIIARTPEESAATRKISEIFNGSPEPGILYDDLCALPRAFAAGGAIFSSGPHETLSKLSDPEFDAAGQVILPEGTPTTLDAGSAGAAGSVEIVERQAGEVTLRANLTRPGYVVFLDRNDPNWHATLDGKEVPILTANVMFRTVECPAGQHEVHFYYRQKGLLAGAAITLVTSLFLSLIFWRNPVFTSLSQN